MLLDIFFSKEIIYFLLFDTIQQSGKFLSIHGLHCERQSLPCQRCSLMNGGHGDWIGKKSFSEDHKTHPDTFSHVCKKVH